MPVALAPCVPNWVRLEREEIMQVDKRVLRSVVFLGVPVGDAFSADGTGFFFRITEEDEAFSYIVTCRHVVDPFVGPVIDEKQNDEPIWIRVNRNNKDPKIYRTKRSDWICHPKSKRSIDICVHEVPLRAWESQDDAEIGWLSADKDLFTPDREREHGKLSLGDPLFMPALFTNRPGEKRNIPVFRTASVAALAEEPVPYGSPYRSAFLVETKSLGGTSGAPVFVHLAEGGRYLGANDSEWSDVWKNPETGEIEPPYYLIGMMQGTHSGRYESDFLPDKDGNMAVLPKDADFNAGIGTVLPYPLILEVIDNPVLKERRMAAIEASKKRSGYRPASASGTKPEPPTTGDTPDHREAFSRLLDAAVSRPKPDRGT